MSKKNMYKKYEQKLLWLCASIVILTGCAAKPTVSEFQCLAGDWETIGYRDGASGLASTRLLNHTEACGPHGVVPDRSVYLQGWEAGLATYCTAENGFRLGSQGKREYGLCDERGEGFAQAYRDGQELYKARAAVAQASQALTYAQNRLQNVKAEIVEVTAAQLNGELTVTERAELLAQLNRLVEERVTLSESIPELAATLDARQHDLDSLQRLVAYQG